MMTNKTQQKYQTGLIQLGIIGVLFLLGGLAVGTKLVTNSDLVFFNIAEKANNVDEENCHGCLGNDELRWDRKANDGEGECKKRASATCKGEGGGGGVPPTETCEGKCISSEETCTSQGLVNGKGSCNKGKICCYKGVAKTATPTQAPTSTVEPRRGTGKASPKATPSPLKNPYCSTFQKIDCLKTGKTCEATTTGGKCVDKVPTETQTTAPKPKDTATPISTAKPGSQCWCDITNKIRACDTDNNGTADEFTGCLCSGGKCTGPIPTDPPKATSKATPKTPTPPVSCNEGTTCSCSGNSKVCTINRKIGALCLPPTKTTTNCPFGCIDGECVKPPRTPKPTPYVPPTCEEKTEYFCTNLGWQGIRKTSSTCSVNTGYNPCLFGCSNGKCKDFVGKEPAQSCFFNYQCKSNICFKTGGILSWGTCK